MKDKANVNEKVMCSECKEEIGKKKFFVIDEKPVCARCLFGDAEPFEIYPIGIVRNGLSRSASGFGTDGEGRLSTIELLPSQKRFMHALEDEESLTVVYYLHKSKTIKSVFKRGLDGKRAGVFATRTPDRLSRIGIQDVKLVKIEETSIYVEGLDAIDGTPVLDIKMCWSSSKRR